MHSQCKFMPFTGDCHLVSCARDGQVRLAELSSTGACKETKKLAAHRGAAHKVCQRNRISFGIYVSYRACFVTFTYLTWCFVTYKHCNIHGLWHAHLVFPSNRYSRRFPIIKNTFSIFVHFRYINFTQIKSFVILFILRLPSFPTHRTSSTAAVKTPSHTRSTCDRTNLKSMPYIRTHS